MSDKTSSDRQYTKKETESRRDNALLRALKTPPKPHEEMKLGKTGAANKPKKKPASKAG